MSLRKRTAEYAVAALVLSLGVVAASMVVGIPMPSLQSTSSSSTLSGGQSGTLPIQLTDPPEVPRGTTALNLTYSSLGLLVGEPSGTSGELTTNTVTVAAAGGSSELDLLRLQNVSVTIANASLPAGSVLYSVTFAVTSMRIDVNGTVSTMSLAAGGSSFTVTIAHPRAFGSGDFALLELNPVAVSTPTGYQLIPSSVGVMEHGEGAPTSGSEHAVSDQFKSDLLHARGNLTATLTGMSVSGNVTTITVLVNNTGSLPVELGAVSISGNFTVVGSLCRGSGMGGAEPPDEYHCGTHLSSGQEVFIPVAPSAVTPSGTACAPAKLVQAGDMGSMGDAYHNSTTLGAGQCIRLTYVGVLGFGFGEFHFGLVPSTLAGQVYYVQIVATFGAQIQMQCTLPLGAGSCTPAQGYDQFHD